MTLNRPDILDSQSKNLNQCTTSPPHYHNGLTEPTGKLAILNDGRPVAMGQAADGQGRAPSNTKLQLQIKK